MTIEEFIRLCRLVFASGGFDEGNKAWQTLKAFVLAQQTTNTGSPKFPTLEEVEHDVFTFYVSKCMNGDLGPSTRRVIKDTYEFIVGKIGQGIEIT